MNGQAETHQRIRKVAQTPKKIGWERTANLDVSVKNTG